MQQAENPTDDYLLLGEISAVFGVKGWVKVFSHTSPRVQITHYKEWFLHKPRSSDWVPIKVLQGRVQGKNIVARLEGINERSQAEALIGSKIAIKNSQLEKLSEGEFYWKDLIGLNVETLKGENLGNVDWVFDTGSNDVLILKKKTLENENDKHERMLPFLMNDVVVSVDLAKNLMIVDWDFEF
jgi:16S rRNA processing protein RimM